MNKQRRAGLTWYDRFYWKELSDALRRLLAVNLNKSLR